MPTGNAPLGISITLSFVFMYPSHAPNFIKFPTPSFKSSTAMSREEKRSPLLKDTSLLTLLNIVSLSKLAL